MWLLLHHYHHNRLPLWEGPFRFILKNISASSPSSSSLYVRCLVNWHILFYLSDAKSMWKYVYGQCDLIRPSLDKHFLAITITIITTITIIIIILTKNTVSISGSNLRGRLPEIRVQHRSGRERVWCIKKRRIKCNHYPPDQNILIF